jgi:hypothetical protein
LVARDRNLLTHSGGHKPIRPSIIPEMLPDWQAEFTYNSKMKVLRATPTD